MSRIKRRCCCKISCSAEEQRARGAVQLGEAALDSFIQLGNATFTQIVRQEVKELSSATPPVTSEPPAAVSMGLGLQQMPPTLRGRSSPSPMTRMVNSVANLLRQQDEPAPGGLRAVSPGQQPALPSQLAAAQFARGVSPMRCCTAPALSPPYASAPPQAEALEGIASSGAPNVNQAAVAAKPVQVPSAACGPKTLPRVRSPGGSFTVPAVQVQKVPTTVRSGQPQQPQPPQAAQPAVRGGSPTPVGLARLPPSTQSRGRSPPPQSPSAVSPASGSPRPIGQTSPSSWAMPTAKMPGR